MKRTSLNFLLPKFKLNSRALLKLEAAQLNLLSVLQLPQHVQVPAGTNRESLKCCQECWSRRLCPDLKFIYAHESSCSQEIFSLLCRSKRQWRNTQNLVYLYKIYSLQAAGVDSCCRQDPCSSNPIKSKADLGWKGSCFVCLMLFPQFLNPSMTVNKKGNEEGKKGNQKITIDIFSFFPHQRSLRKGSCLSQKQPELFPLDSEAQVWITRICLL